MKEIELKILNIDKAKITKTLLEIGAKRVSSVLLIDKKYDFPGKKLSKKHEHLRLRKYGNKIEINFKTKNKDKNFLINDELETEVKDYETMEKIIKKLGLIIITHREKKRTSFILGKVKIEIDENPKIPAYIEIEGEKKDVKNMVELLGFRMEDTCNLTTSQVLKSYGVNPDFIKFKKGAFK